MPPSCARKQVRAVGSRATPFIVPRMMAHAYCLQVSFTCCAHAGDDPRIVAAGIVQVAVEEIGELPPPSPRNYSAEVLQQPWVPWHLDRLNQHSLPLDGKYTPTATGAGVHVFIVSSVGWAFQGCGARSARCCQRCPQCRQILCPWHIAFGDDALLVGPGPKVLVKLTRLHHLDASPAASNDGSLLA
jgi:hypothetical protein